jgi:hypothetical protein
LSVAEIGPTNRAAPRSSKHPFIVKTATVLSIFGALLLGIASEAGAASIGINFTGGTNNSSPAVSLLTTDLAGVIPQLNWNNFAGGNGAGLSLLDNSGASSGALLTFTASGVYSSIGGAGIAPANGDEKLNTGFVYGNSSFTLTNVPYALFDVYVYELNDAGGRVETTTLGALSFFGSAATPTDASHVDQNAGTSYLYTQSTSTDVANPTAGGDYVRFSNLSGTVTINASAPGNGYVNGLQIVQVPEPASMGLLGLGAAVGAWTRRRGTRAAR